MPEFDADPSKTVEHGNAQRCISRYPGHRGVAGKRRPAGVGRIPEQLGRVAIVAGAGIGGLTAARVLADYFEKVIVMEGDATPQGGAARPGTPQARHVHALLGGGLNALLSLFPVFDADLTAAGAVPIRMTEDLLLYRPGYHPFPQRHLDLSVYSISRPALEWLVRKRVEAHGNIRFRQNCKALEFVKQRGARSIHAVKCQTAAGIVEEIPCGFAVDATGHGRLTLNLFAAEGVPPPEENTVAIDLGYATAAFEIPPDGPSDWKAVTIHPHPPGNSRGAFLFPVEGNRWMVSLTGRYDEKPSGSEEDFFHHLQALPVPTLFHALRGAKRCGEISRYGFPASRRRRFDRNFALPENLIPMGDTMCRFNPVHGQGVSVAAQQACSLRNVLAGAVSRGSLQYVSLQFVKVAQNTIEAPWATAVVPDFQDERTVGVRPPDLETTMKFTAAVLRKAAEDPAAHKLMLEVQNLLKPRSALREIQIDD